MLKNEGENHKIRRIDQTKESLVLLKVLSQSKKSLNEGKYKTHTKAFRDLKNKSRKFNEI
ncbi:MAG: hypothetical protein MRK02_13170 [Candidatus Scalindua sp.]|nr:hypothetical protein [Candidatus Scalindua sp.]